MTDRKKIRLIHTSDTHLGGDWRPAVVEDAFRAVVDSVDAMQGDGLLIVGDVFDHARVPDRVLELFLEQIARLEIPVVVLPGNHDLYNNKDSLYLRQPFRKAPPNLFLFTEPEGESISFSDLTLDLWGKGNAAAYAGVSATGRNAGGFGKSLAYCPGPRTLPFC